MHRTSLLSLLTVAAGCVSDFGLGTDQDASEYAPIIRVDPPVLDFGEMEPGATAYAEVNVYNDGDAALFLSEVGIEGSDAFKLVSDDAAALVDGLGAEIAIGPGESAALQLSYSAINLEDLGLLWIESNDLATPVAQVELLGVGLIPVLQIDPSPYDFGYVPLDCTNDAVVQLHNIGTTDLHIDGIDAPTSPFGLAWIDDLPITIVPGQHTDLRLAFTPSGEVDYSGDYYVYSDDPAGMTLGQLYGSTDTGVRTERFWQLSGEKADLFFYVDRSRSMTDDIDNLSQNYDQLIGALEDYGVDYQIMVATNDDGCHNEEIITPDTADAADVFKKAAKGQHNQWTEAGLTIAQAALAQTGIGRCNDGFLRDGAKPVAVLISDEREQSRRSWDHYTFAMMDDAPSLAVVAVVGPPPLGCSTAEAGDGYIEAAEYTGGGLLSICSANWGSYFDDIALEAAEGLTDTFTVSGEPVNDAITVEVDGAPVDEGWRWDAASKSVIFDADAVPEADSLVEITYETTPEECED